MGLKFLYSYPAKTTCMKKLLLLCVLCTFSNLRSQVGPPPPCIPPANIVVTAITHTSATFSWTELESATAWEVLILPAGAPSPGLSDATGFPVNTTTYTAAGLVCGTVYDFYVRDQPNCPGPSFWGGPYAFATVGCLGGQPADIYACPENGLACFDLHENDANILDNLDPEAYTLTYYSQYQHAVDAVNPLESPICFTGSGPAIFARLEENATGQFYISPFGLLLGGTDCPRIALHAYFDTNGNGTQEPGENYYAFGQTNLGHFTYEANNDGNLREVYTNTGNHTIYDSNTASSYDLHYVINPQYADYFSAPAFTNVHTGSEASGAYNFPIAPIAGFHDARVSMYTTSRPRPGFEYVAIISYSNNTFQTETSGSIIFTKDPALSILSVGATVNPTADGFTYDFTNLLPFETRTIAVTMQVPVIPAVSLGQLVSSGVSVNISGDVNPANDSFSVTEAIIGSFDPNDKMESHGPKILISSFTPDDYLFYTIRFENTGTASTLNIKITDTLDGQLDENTVEMISVTGSNCNMLREGRNLTWFFEGINLPPTIENPEQSQGQVSFKVKPKPGYAVGDVIPNQASIYFDFNPPIVTEPFQTHFVDVLQTENFSTEALRFYPNPASDRLNLSLKTSEKIRSVSLFDFTGKKVMDEKTAKVSDTVINVGALSAGVYLLKITTDQNRTLSQKILIR